MTDKSKNPKKADGPIEIMEFESGELDMWLLGSVPGLLMNRQSEKVKRQLLLPARRRSKSELELSLKHDPVAEFQAAAYILRDEGQPTYLGMPAPAFKAALRSATVDIGGTKAQIGRLVYVPGEFVPVFGNPQLKMDVTRMADRARTPDIRTRPLLKEWCAKVTLRFIRPHLTEHVIAQLAAAAGMFIGWGDYRTEKGSGSHGGWRIVAEDDPDVVRIRSTWGREAQKAALDAAIPADQDSRDLLEWYVTEVGRREMQAGKSKKLKTAEAA